MAFIVEIACLKQNHPEYDDGLWRRLWKGGVEDGEGNVVFQGREYSFQARHNLFARCLKGEWTRTPSGLTGVSLIKAQEIRAIPDPKDWPAWARYVGRLHKEGEKGVGDTVHRILGRGGEWFKRWYRNKTGEECNCTRRQSAWNVMYPYLPR